MAKIRPDKSGFHNLLLILFIFFTLPPVPARGAEAADYASDLIRPQITVISPLPDGVSDTSTPKIQVSFVDTGSGIDETTIHLVLDRIDVTRQSVIERIDVTGQAKNSPRKITYRPSVSLAQGFHQVSFNVRDLAGNLAVLHWQFEIKGVGPGKFRIGGSNTLQFDATPIEKTTDIWDLTAQGQCGETGIQLRLLGRVTDYPNATPNFRIHEYNFYYDKYTIQFNRRKFSLAMGYVTASINSELLQIGLEVKGGVAGDTVNLPDGQWNWSFFSGKTGSSYGVGMNVYDINGFGGEWHSASGWGLGGYYAGINDAGGYSYGGINGNMMLGGSVLFRYELIHGDSWADGRSGNGMALHFDTSLDSTAIGFDYFGLQPGYPAPGSSGLILTGGGMQRYTARSVIAINKEQNVNIDATVAMDNPGGNFTTRNNLNIGYHLNPTPGVIFNANYQGDFQNNEGMNKISSHGILLNLRKTTGQSTLQTSLSLGETLQSQPGDSYDQIQLFSAWTKPIGEYHLTPSAQWTYQYKLNGIYSLLIDTRLTLSRQFHSDLAASRIALFCQKNEDWNTSPPFFTNIGLEAEININLWPNSSLYFSGNCAKWIREGLDYSDGWNAGLHLSWKMVF